MRRHRRAADSFGGGGLWPVGLGLLSLSRADVPRYMFSFPVPLTSPNRGGTGGRLRSGRCKGTRGPHAGKAHGVLMPVAAVSRGVGRSARYVLTTSLGN